MGHIMLWLNIHRMGVIIVFGICLWIGAYATYLRPIISNLLYRGRPHNWSVDLTTKKAVARGKVQNN